MSDWDPSDEKCPACKRTGISAMMTIRGEVEPIEDDFSGPENSLFEELWQCNKCRTIFKVIYQRVKIVQLVDGQERTIEEFESNERE